MDLKTSLKTSQKIKKVKKREITINQFDFIWNKKILGNLETRDQFTFQEMNVLLNAYEYWRYENINK